MSQSKLLSLIYLVAGLLMFWFLFTNIFSYSKANATTVQFVMKFQGTYNFSYSVKAKIELYNQKKKIQTWNDIIFNQDGHGQYTGEITIPSLNEADFYAFTIKPDKSLQQLVCDYGTTNFCSQPKLILKQAQNSIDMTQSLFYVGDTNNDGKIDSLDMSTILKYLGKQDQEALNNADNNRDGIVDTTDYVLAIRNMSLNTVDIYPLWMGEEDPLSTPSPQPTITTTMPTITPILSNPTSISAGVTCKITLQGSIRICKYLICGSRESNEQQTKCIVPAYCNNNYFYNSMKEAVNKEIEKNGYTVDWPGSSIRVETEKLSPC